MDCPLADGGCSLSEPGGRSTAVYDQPKPATYALSPAAVTFSIFSARIPAMTPRLKDILISSIISIGITVVFGYYFLYLGDKQREPTFYEDPTRTLIIDRANAADAPLQLLKPNRDSITSDVVSVYVYFFNQGKETIKRENIYAPLQIKVDTSAEILYFKVLKTARNVSGIYTSRDSLGRFVNIDFNALEKDDGFVAQLMYEGNRNARIELIGGIEGAKEFKTELSTIHPLYFLIALLLFLVAAYILLILNKRTAKSTPKFLFFFSALPVLYLLLMLYKSEWFIDHKVPQTLRIENYVQHSRNQVFDVYSWFK
jgi:hypothetical protein